MLIAASEDIGNSNPNALLLAGECFRSVQAVGMPEARIILGQTAVYLATSAKSNSTYLAITGYFELAEKNGKFTSTFTLEKCANQTDETARLWN